MIRKTILAVGLVALAAATAQAQDPARRGQRHGGWTFSDGVSGGTTTVNGEDFSRIDPKDAFSWGARIGFFATPNVEVGALFSSQATQLEISGVANTIELGDETVYNYHGYVAYNFGDPDASVRPYFLGGLGATQYGTVKVEHRRRPAGHRRHHQVLDDVGARREAVSGQERRHPTRGSLDPDVHQVRRRPAGGATPTGAATPRATRSTRTSSS